MFRPLAIAVSALAAFGAVVPEAHALPDVQWSTYYGGTGYDRAFGVRFDGAGDLVVVGQTGSAAGIADSGEDNYYGGDGDGFVAKFDGQGNRLWGTYLGGSLPDYLRAAVTDSDDNIIVVGVAQSTGLSTLSTSHDGDWDVLLAKYDPSGSLLWSTYIGGDGSDFMPNLCVAGNGTVYVVGQTNSASGLAAGSVHDTTYSGTTEGFIAKVTSAGSLVWATYYGHSSGATLASACAVSPFGEAYVVGTTAATSGIALNAAHDGSFNGFEDAFLAKFTSQGSLAWANYYGGSSLDEGNAVDVDSSGNVYIAGRTYSTNGANQAIATTVDTSLGGASDGFVAKFNSSGARVWGRYFGGSSSEGFADLEISAANVLYLVGVTHSASGVHTSNAFDSTLSGTQDAMFVTLTSDTAVQLDGSYLGGGVTEEGLGVAVGYNEAAICGLTTSSSEVASAGAHDTTYNGNSDAFVTWLHLFDV